MSFARLSDDSDVYLYDTPNDLWICHWCPEQQSETVVLHSARALYWHIRGHRDRGFKVPESALTTLLAECPWWYRLWRWVVR